LDTSETILPRESVATIKLVAPPEPVALTEYIASFLPFKTCQPGGNPTDPCDGANKFTVFYPFKLLSSII
jgi:hypothetical protein